MTKHPKTETNYFLEGAQAFAKFMDMKGYDPALTECPYPEDSVMSEQWHIGWEDALYNEQNWED